MACVRPQRREWYGVWPDSGMECGLTEIWSVACVRPQRAVSGWELPWQPELKATEAQAVQPVAREACGHWAGPYIQA